MQFSIQLDILGIVGCRQKSNVQYVGVGVADASDAVFRRTAVEMFVTIACWLAYTSNFERMIYKPVHCCTQKHTDNIRPIHCSSLCSTAQSVFYARQHNAIARICHGNSVCLSVCHTGGSVKSVNISKTVPGTAKVTIND